MPTICPGGSTLSRSYPCYWLDWPLWQRAGCHEHWHPSMGGSAPIVLKSTALSSVPLKGASTAGCSNISCTQHQDGTRLPLLYHLF